LRSRHSVGAPSARRRSGRAHLRAGKPAARRRAPQRHGSQANVYVGGATATLQDLAEKIAGRLPIFIAIVVRLSVLLLMAVFPSLWVPLVSAAFNLLSIAAAYGVVVLVFQDAVGSSLLGVDGEVPIVSFVPLRASLSSSSTSRISGPTSARPCWHSTSSSVPAACGSLRCSLSAGSSGYPRSAS
jgi:hypothetical protein